MFRFLKKTIKHLHLKLKWNKKLRFQFSCDISMNSNFEGMSQIHPNTYFHGSLGYGSYIGSNCNISADIGRFTSIAPFVRCNAGIHPYTSPYVTTSPCFYSLNPYHSQNGSTFAKKQMYNELALYNCERNIAVKIGSDCWIGEGAFLVGGIKIGNGAVVLAHAVVTKDVPDFAIVGGVPAKILSYRYDKDTIAFLNEIKWWNNHPNWFEKNWELLSNIEKLKAHYNKNEETSR